MDAMEARGLGASDVHEVERFLTRLQAQKLARSSATSRSSALSKVVPTSSHDKLPASFSPEPSDFQRLLQPTEMKLAFGIDPSSSGRPQTTPARARNRSADPNIKRHMAIDCGLKSVPVNDKKGLSSTMSLPPSRMSIKDSDTGKPGGTKLQSQVLLLATEESAHVRRGLGGSKIRSGAKTPRRDARTPRFDLLDTGAEHREGSILIAPSPRAQSIRYSPPSVTGSAETENCQPPKGHSKWNHSDQGLRLQKQTSHLNSTRAMKRASEMVQHRLDHMYLMSGNKCTLQQRYNIDDMEMRKLQEMAQTRKDLVSDLKKMKYPYSVKSSASYPMNSLEPRPSQSYGVNQSQSTFITNPGPVNRQKLVYSSPSSELDSASTARDNIPKYRPPHEANKEVITYEDNDDDYYDDEINSWNGPL